jgi:hypothetical protein
MADRDPKVRFTVTLEGKRADENANIHSLRFLLKRLLRSRSLKCVDAREINITEDKP